MTTEFIKISQRRTIQLFFQTLCVFEHKSCLGHSAQATREKKSDFSKIIFAEYKKSHFFSDFFTFLKQRHFFTNAVHLDFARLRIQRGIRIKLSE